MKTVKIKMHGNSVGIHLPSEIRQEIGIPMDTEFKIWRDGGKIKLESVNEKLN
jgi:antitoxin component of MazEF toxin-antitoxin module